MQHINTLRESTLHSQLKEWYSKPQDMVESLIEGMIIDIVRGDMLIEIQTRNFSNVKRKITRLLPNYNFRLVYPLISLKYIVRLDKDGEGILSRRLSPKRGNYIDLFYELVNCAEFTTNKNFSIEVVLVEVEEYRIFTGLGSWRRRGWSVVDRRLLSVFGSRIFCTPNDYRALLPDDLHQPFTTRDLQQYPGINRNLSGRIVSSLRRMGVINLIGKEGRFNLYLEH